MRRLKSIDEIYEEVKDYDLVITNDVALETALNARIDTARIGTFAITPRHLARELFDAILDEAEMSELELVARVSKETELDFKYVYSEIQNFRMIRKYTSQVRPNLSTARSRRVYDAYESLPTRERAMGSYEPDYEPDPAKRKKIAILEPRLFDDLDRHFTPYDFDELSIFKDQSEGRFDIDRFYRVGNDRQLADNAVELVDPENPWDFAIVMNASSPIADAVRAALYRKNLPFVNSLAVRDLTPVRDFLSFITYSMDYDTVRVGQVKELFASFREYFKPGRDGYLLSKIDDGSDMVGNPRLRGIMRCICHDGMTFKEVMDLVCDANGKSRVGTILKSLLLEDETITPRNLSELIYAVDNVTELKHNEQIPDSEKTGVVLVDCMNSVYIDRPVVIYLGLGQDWNIPIPSRRFIDAEEEADNNAIRLSALLQQGEKRVYLINSTKNGKEAKPCTTFKLLMDEKCEVFSDIAPVTSGRWVVDEQPKDLTRGESVVEELEPYGERFSKSSFNDYYSCPRKYMYHALLGSEDSKSSKFGTLIHSFAEIYACHKDEVEARGLDWFASKISERYSGLSSPTMEKMDLDSVNIALMNIKRYIDSHGIDAMEGHSVPLKHRNELMEILGIEDTSDLCEEDVKSYEHPIHGIFDLYWDGTVIDYKTGTMPNAAKIANEMVQDSGVSFPEFQPLFYLALARTAGHYKDSSNGIFEMFYAMGNDVESSSEGYDIDNNVRRVRLIDSDLSVFIAESPEMEIALHDKLKPSMKQHARAVLDAIASSARGAPEGWRADLNVVEAVIERTGLRGKRGADDAGVAIGYVAEMLKEDMAIVGDTVVVTPKAIETFLDAVDSMNAKAESESLTDMPASPRKGIDCRKCEYFQACTRDVVILDDPEEGE